MRNSLYISNLLIKSSWASNSHTLVSFLPWVQEHGQCNLSLSLSLSLSLCQMENTKELKGVLWKQLLQLLQSHLKRKGASKGNLFVVYESHPSWHRPLHHDQHMFESNLLKLVSLITMLENSEYSILLSFGIKRVIVTLNLRDSSLSLPKTIATKAYEQLIDKIDKNEWISSDSSTHRLKESVWGTWITISDWL